MFKFLVHKEQLYKCQCSFLLTLSSLSYFCVLLVDINLSYESYLGFSGGASGKEPTYYCRRWKRHKFDLWLGKIPWNRKWQSTPGFLPGKFHGQRSLAGYSPWSHMELQRVGHDWMHTPTHCTSLIILLFWMPNNFCLYSRLSHLPWTYFFKEYSALFWHAVAFELFEFFKVFFYIFLMLIQGSLFSSSVQSILLLRKKC